MIKAIVNGTLVFPDEIKEGTSVPVWSMNTTTAF